MEAVEEVVKRGRGRPKGAKNKLPAGEKPVAADADIAEYELREKAVKMGLMSEAIAASLPIAELKTMLQDAADAGLPADKSAPPVSTAVASAKSIIAGLLVMVAVKSANQMPMNNCCTTCELMPDHLKEACVCHQARRYLEIVDG